MVTKKVDEEPDAWAEPSVPVNERDFLTVTLKAGTGYDAPWLVFHTNSVEEALTTLQHEQLDELMDLTARKGKELVKAFGGLQGASKFSAGTGWGGNTTQASSISAGAVEWDADAEDYVCAHGSATQRKGQSAKGPWTGYFCPEPKGSPNQCAPKFLNQKRG